MNERDRCVDVARGLGIALVVLGHNPLVLHGPTGEPFRVIYSFHMPLFFFLSGTFFNARRPWWESALGRADALLKPYAVTLLAFAFADLLLGGQEFWMHLLRMAYATGEALQSGWVPLWFLPHLFVLSLVGWCALRALGRRTALVRWTWTAALLVAGVASIDLAWRREVSIFGAQIALPGLPFSVDLLPVTLSFFLAGAWLRPQVEGFRPRPALLVLALAAFVACHALLDVTINLNTRKYPVPWCTTLQAGAGIYLTLSLAHLLLHWPVLERPLALLGRASLFVLLFHGALQEAVFHAFAGTDAVPRRVVESGALLVALTGPLAFWWLAWRVPAMGRWWLPRPRKPQGVVVS